MNNQLVVAWGYDSPVKPSPISYASPLELGSSLRRIECKRPIDPNLPIGSPQWLR